MRHIVKMMLVLQAPAAENTKTDDHKTDVYPPNMCILIQYTPVDIYKEDNDMYKVMIHLMAYTKGNTKMLGFRKIC